MVRFDARYRPPPQSTPVTRAMATRLGSRDRRLRGDGCGDGCGETSASTCRQYLSVVATKVHDVAGVEAVADRATVEHHEAAIGFHVDGAADHFTVRQLDTHLLAWAPLFLFAAQRTARTLLYREAADATLQLLLTDSESRA